ncbi:uncharacterized protein [Apostichopus japonicus]|uniref:uncharacterized protein n=1 Tax=Stichopus japonicus TaxID=307972 RepID=UPI003AB24C5E
MAIYTHVAAMIFVAIVTVADRTIAAEASLTPTINDDQGDTDVVTEIQFFTTVFEDNENSTENEITSLSPRSDMLSVTPIPNSNRPSLSTSLSTTSTTTGQESSPPNKITTSDGTMTSSPTSTSSSTPLSSETITTQSEATTTKRTFPTYSHGSSAVTESTGMTTESTTRRETSSPIISSTVKQTTTTRSYSPLITSTHSSSSLSKTSTHSEGTGENGDFIIIIAIIGACGAVLVSCLCFAFSKLRTRRENVESVDFMMSGTHISLRVNGLINRESVMLEEEETPKNNLPITRVSKLPHDEVNTSNLSTFTPGPESLKRVENRSLCRMFETQDEEETDQEEEEEKNEKENEQGGKKMDETVTVREREGDDDDIEVWSDFDTNSLDDPSDDENIGLDE